ncbi:MAG: guanylate kinase [Simkania sp.]|nr:guanylate kinase [Simkania sp.]
MKQCLLGNLKKGLLFVISAPAGTGKTTLVRKLMEEFSCITESVSCTTRAVRSGEVDGKDYFFISKQEFNDRVLKKDFLEHAEVFGDQYGTSRSFVETMRLQGKHVILVIDTQGAMQLKNQLDAVFIFLRPPSLEELRVRLVKRQTETSEAIEKRVAWAAHELTIADQYDYQVVNDNLDVAYLILRSIIIAEEHKTCHFQQFFTKKG